VTDDGATEPPVLLAFADGVARITLNRPEAANALDVELARAFHDAVDEIVDAEGVRAVVLEGAGTRFCGGGDVRAFAGADELGSILEEVLSFLHPAVADLAELPAPVVASVQGSAAGAGLALVAGADLVVAAASARFVLAYTAIGLVPDGGSTWYLPRVIGTRRALELALTNRVLSADEACEWGLVSRVVPDDSLASETATLVRSLAAGPTRAFAATKRLLRSSLSMPLESQLTHEATEMVVAGESEDGIEGVAAFAEKRPPTFTGD
jgi:2-(1,2-epoxy-1,2-dihydrophenyl)acetyl-CoA isomerase